jgi:GTP-binding protein
MPGRQNGVLISKGTGEAVAYSMFKLSERGRFFIEPGVDVYSGQIVGDTNRPGDMVVNLQTAKQLTNVRASGSDEAISMEPPLRMSLEQNLEYIEGDEYVEVTPKSIRLRKIYLDENERKRFEKSRAAAAV